MDLLRRIVLIQALVWATCGATLAIAPRLILITLFDLSPYPEYGYVRVAGLFSFTLAMLMVLVSRRLETLWWFCWAFVIGAAGSAIIATLTAAFAVPDGASPTLWWLFAAVSIGLTVGLLAGLAKIGSESPPQ